MPFLHEIHDFLPKDYGFVVAVVVGQQVINSWLSFRVVKARKQYKVEYPDMYSKDSKEFNCIQRAHQNTLEMYPSSMFLMLVGGLQYPRPVAIAGVFYLLGRVLYAIGYTSEDPNRAMKYGAVAVPSHLIFLLATMGFAYRNIKSGRGLPL